MPLRLLLLPVLFASVLAAQTAGTATLVGTVTDSSGAIMPNAKVTVVNVDTSFVSEAASNTEGFYHVPFLAPGTYRLTVETSGFKRYVREGILVRTAETPRIDVSLEVGALTENVTVSGAPQLLETETSTAGQILSGETLLKIPLSQKRSIRMLFYYPGTSSMGGFHILGQRQEMIGYTVDGINGKEPGTQSIGGTDDQISTTQDAFQEVKVYTTGMPAEYGHGAGGLMSIVFKSGGNQFHGSAEDRHISKSMIHRSYLEQLKPTNPFSYHEMAFLGTGPVLLPKIYNGANKTFWLFGWARHREIGGTSSAITTVPTPGMYNGDFSFAGQGGPAALPIYNPFTTRLVGTTWTRDPFPGNIVPKDLFDPATKNFLARNPFTQPNQAGIPSATGPTQNLVMNQEKQIRRTRWDVKIDHQFTPNHRISSRYSQARHRAWKGDYQAQFAWRDIDPNAQPAPIDQMNMVFSDMLILSPSMSNEFRIGYNRRARYETALTKDQDWAKQLGIPNADGGTFPNFAIGYGLSGLSSFQNVGEDVTVQDNLTWVAGKHTLKTGYELVRTRYNATSAVLPGGSYTFGGTQNPFVPNTGNTFASFLLGTVTSASFTQQFASWLPRWWSHQAYLQDDWKPAKGLTINLGLRWSWESPFHTKYGQQSQYDPSVKDPVSGLTGALVHKAGPLAGNDWNNFAPRVGLAWNFHPKMVFRASFGMVHQDVFSVGTGMLFQEYLATATVAAPTGDPRHAFRLSEGPPSFQYQVQPDGSVPFVGSNYSTRSASGWDTKMRMPYVMSWSGGVQWEFAQNWLLEGQYQGQSGVGLVNSWDTNAIPLNVSSDPAVLNQIFQATQNYKPKTQFGSINLYSNYGHNTYHSGTVRVEKRISHGLSFNPFYTFSKTMTETESGGGDGGITFYNRSLEKARAGYDITHRFVSVLTYELPFGKGRQFLNSGGIVNSVLGGWEFTGVQTFQSGVPFTVSFSGSQNRYLPGESRPNILTNSEGALTPNWEMGPNRFPTSAQNSYLNFAAFAYPAAFTAGTLGRNTFEGPGLSWTQVSLAKWWHIGERYKLQLRFDGHNFPFKQPNFANPNSAFSANSPGTFGRITGVQGSYSGIGSGRANMYGVLRFEF